MPNLLDLRYCHISEQDDMNKKLFIGNLSFKVNESQLEQVFSQAGEVVAVSIPTNRETGRKRGFAFVEYKNSQDAEAACERFNGMELEGRPIAVNPSQPKENGPPRRPNNNRR